MDGKLDERGHGVLVRPVARGDEALGHVFGEGDVVQIGRKTGVPACGGSGSAGSAVWWQDERIVGMGLPPGTTEWKRGADGLEQDVVGDEVGRCLHSAEPRERASLVFEPAVAVEKLHRTVPPARLIGHARFGGG